MNIFWNLVKPFWFGDEDFSTNWYQICSKKIGRSLLAHVDPYVYFGTVLWVQKISGESAVKRQKAFPPLPLTTQWTEKRTVPWDGAFY